MEVETYYPYSRYLRETFGEKTYKITVSSGLTCPTRDGTLAKRGCAFCDLRGSSSFYGKIGRGKPIAEQIQKRMPGVRERFGAKKFLAYFQSYTNTYSDIDYLRGIYEEALAQPEISGLCIGTRPDCIPDPVIDLLEEISQKHYVSLELGVQSFEDATLEWLERGHDGACSVDALERLARKGPHIHTCAHFMFGCPTDTPEGPKNAALILNDLGVKGAKLHQLMVLDHTILAERYREKPFKTVSIEEYSEIVLQFLEHLSPEIYLERLCAQASHWDECIAPDWSRQHWEPLNAIRAHLDKNQCRQGSKVVQKNSTLN